jgi:large subunit ribosomal protein L3
MPIEIMGQKCGMTRLFTDAGESIPATVIKVEPNRVVQIKEDAKTHYLAVQVTYGTKSLSKVNKPLGGHFSKAALEPGRKLWEFRLSENEKKDFAVGKVLKADVFKVGDLVDVQSFSKGKGFAGVIKRYNFSSQDATHGNSLSHNAPGSIGQRQTPGRVFPGKKMAGHLGNAKCTIQNQKVSYIDLENNLLLISGGVPGAPNGNVIIKFAAKGKKKGNEHGT